MPCKNLRPRLALLSGGEIDGPARLEIESHLANCPTCRSAADAFGRQRDVLGRFGRDLRTNGAAPDLFSGVSNALEVRAARRGPRFRGSY